MFGLQWCERWALWHLPIWWWFKSSRVVCLGRVRCCHWWCRDRPINHYIAWDYLERPFSVSTKFPLKSALSFQPGRSPSLCYSFVARCADCLRVGHGGSTAPHLFSGWKMARWARPREGPIYVRTWWIREVLPFVQGWSWRSCALLILMIRIMIIKRHRGSVEKVVEVEHHVSFVHTHDRTAASWGQCETIEFLSISELL